MLACPEDVAAAEALIQISQTVDTFALPPTDNNNDDDGKNHVRIRCRDADTLMAVWQNKQDLQSLSPPEDPTFLHDILQIAPLQDFVRLALRTSVLDGEAERRIRAVLQVMKSRNCAQEAMWYLDENEWDVRKATTQYRADEALRRQRASPLYALVNRQANPVTYRNFRPCLLEFDDAEDPVDNPSTKTSVPFPNSVLFDRHNRSHLQALNQWRSDLSREHRPLPPVEEFLRTGYTGCEERFLRNRFADLLDEFKEGKTPAAKDIVRDFNVVFQGRYVPGAVDPCGPRRLGSISNFIDRNWKRDENGRRVRYLANYRAALRIKLVREGEQREYDALMGLGGVDA